MITMFDGIALGVIFICTLTSLMRGVVAELVSLLTWVVSFMAARLFAPTVGNLAFSTQTALVAEIGGFVLTFIAVGLLMRLLRSFLSSLVYSLGLGGINRLLGAVLGMIKGVFIITLAVMLLSLTHLPQTQDWQNAWSSSYFEQLAKLFLPYLSEALTEAKVISEK